MDLKISSSAEQTVVEIQSVETRDLDVRDDFVRVKNESSVTPLPDIVAPDITDEEWIRGIKQSSYIIQFGSSVDISLFDEFIPVINNGDPIAVYPYKLMPSDRQVCGITSGGYDSGDAALDAIELSPRKRAHTKHGFERSQMSPTK